VMGLMLAVLLVGRAFSPRTRFPAGPAGLKAGRGQD
jgi:hypothetical protein